MSLMVIEVLVLTVRFDSAVLANNDQAWSRLLSQGPLAGQFAISLLAALAVFSGNQFRRGLNRVAARIATVPFPRLALLAHLGRS